MKKKKKTFSRDFLVYEWRVIILIVFRRNDNDDVLFPNG